MTPAWRDPDPRAFQASVLLEMARRLGRGDPPLPTDVIAAVVDELEGRVDGEAVTEAWALQGSEEGTPWESVRARALRG